MDLDTRTGHYDEGERSLAGTVADTSIPARPEAVAAARTVVREAARSLGFGDDRIDDLLVCTSEACTNAIEAQVRAAIEGPVRIRCQVRGTRFAVEIQDAAGGGFDPALLAPRPPLAHPGHLDVERGWGIQLMRELMDAVEFDRQEDGTVVRLLVDLPAGG